jgi:NADH-quinone oxidoreductase subunit E
MESEYIRQKTREVVEPWKGRKGGLIPVLQKVQSEIGYLPPEAMETISQELKLPLAEIYGVVTFYAQFHLKPRGKNIVRVCRGTACHVRGSLKIMNKFKEELKIDDNETTSDLMFTLEPVACLGACGLAPVLMVNTETYGRLEDDSVKKIIEEYRHGS